LEEVLNRNTRDQLILLGFITCARPTGLPFLRVRVQVWLQTGACNAMPSSTRWDEGYFKNLIITYSDAMVHTSASIGYRSAHGRCGVVPVSQTPTAWSPGSPEPSSRSSFPPSGPDSPVSK